jgi:pimeloyl-ACP methyl ester carboxylesterase
MEGQSRARRASHQERPEGVRLRDSEWVLFEDSSHMPRLEERERFLAVVEVFLERVEG